VTWHSDPPIGYFILDRVVLDEEENYTVELAAPSPQPPPPEPTAVQPPSSPPDPPSLFEEYMKTRGEAGGGAR